MRAIINWIIRFGILELLIIFFLAVNVLTFILYVADKRRAVQKKWRISEGVLIFFTLAGGGVGAFFGMWLARHKTKHRKFRVAAAVGLIIAGISILHIGHGLTLGRIVRYTEIEFRSENWPRELDGYRIGFMADMHIIPDEAMRRVVAELNTRDLDLLILGGDFSMRDGHYLGTLREIAQINTTDGIFGVEGNHDDYERLFAAMEQYKITPLGNTGAQIREGFFLAGVHDLWNRHPRTGANTAAAISGADAGSFVLLVSHNPDIAMRKSTLGVDLILSGHTHSGQITFFGVPLYLLRGSITDYGMRFSHGFSYSWDEAPVFVTSGVGTYYNVPRIFARPEVVIFTMYHGME